MPERTIDEISSDVLDYLKTKVSLNVGLASLTEVFPNIQEPIIKRVIDKLCEEGLIKMEEMDMLGKFKYTFYEITANGIKILEKHKSYLKYVKHQEKKERTSRWAIVKDVAGVIGILSAITLGCLNYNKDKRIDNLTADKNSLVNLVADLNKKNKDYIDSSINAQGLKPIPLSDNRKPSFKFPNNPNSGDAPLVAMGIDGKEMEYTPDKLGFKYSFYAQNAACSNFSVTMSSVVTNDCKTYEYDGNWGTYKLNSIPKDRGYEGQIGRDTTRHWKLFITWFRGSYKDLNGINPYTLDYLVLFNNEDGSSSLISTDEQRNEIIGIINKNEKKK